MLIGILALALPIGVMGSSFNRNYAKFHGRIEDSLRASENVSGMSSIDMRDANMVYELNNEVVVRAKDGEDCDEDIFDTNPAKENGGIGMTSYSSVTTLEGIKEDKDNDQDLSTTIDQNGVTVTMTEEKQETLVMKSLSNKDIRKRLQLLSGEISFLMNALDNNDV
jgi:hypothetical protein